MSPRAHATSVRRSRAGSPPGLWSSTEMPRASSWAKGRCRSWRMRWRCRFETRRSTSSWLHSSFITFPMKIVCAFWHTCGGSRNGLSWLMICTGIRWRTSPSADLRQYSARAKWCATTDRSPCGELCGRRSFWILRRRPVCRDGCIAAFHIGWCWWPRNDETRCRDHRRRPGGCSVCPHVRAAGAVEVSSAKVRMGSAEVDVPFQRPGLGISRSALDKIVAGASVHQGFTVSRVVQMDAGFVVSGLGFEVACSAVVDAAGKLSRFTRRRGKEEFGIQYTEEAARGNVLDFWFFEDGYGGAVSVEGRRSNFCFLINKDSLQKYVGRP